MLNSIKKKSTKSTIILRSEFDTLKRKAIIAILIINLIWVGGVFVYYQLKYAPLIKELTKTFNSENEKKLTTAMLTSAVHEYRIKHEILTFLRDKGMSLGQGIDIAEGIVHECKINDLPIDIVMSLIGTESEYYVNAKSRKGALGIMQIMPTTWHDMIQKLNLNVGIQAAYDPRINIKVGCAKLKELYILYNGDQRKIFSAYNAGENGGIQDVYISKVKKGADKFINFKEPLIDEGNGKGVMDKR